MSLETKRSAHRLLFVEDLQEGTNIDGWRVIKQLGHGGFGIVYLVEKDDVRAALKVARPWNSPKQEDTFRAEDRAEREVICALRIKHPNVAKVLAHGRWPHPELGHPYFVMPLVDGDRLDKWARRNVPTVREVMRLFMKLADALGAAHQLGVVHRDIKAENIIVRRLDSEPVILDFGSADFPLSTPLTNGILPPGTPTHRSPEAMLFRRKNEKNPQARYEFKPSDDLYALGVTLHDVLTGVVPFPFEGGPLAEEALALNIEFRHPLPVHERNTLVPEALGEVVSRLLSKNPEDRYASAEALRRDLASLLDGSAPALDGYFSRGLPDAQGEPEVAPEPEAPIARFQPPEAAPEPPPRPMTAALSTGVPGVTTMPLAAHLEAAMGAAGKVLVLMLVAGAALGLYSYLNAPGVTMRAGPSPALTRRAPVAPSTPPVNQPEPEPERPAIVPGSTGKDGSTVTKPAAPSSSSTPTPMEAPTATQQSPGMASSLHETCRALLLGSAAWLAAGCAGAQVRPEPDTCPEEARAAMKKWNLDVPLMDRAQIKYDVRAPQKEGFCLYRPGPVEAVVRDSEGTKLPEGTRLFGRAWVDEKERKAWLLYSTAQLPSGERIPVCIRDDSWPIEWDAEDPYVGCIGRAEPVYVWPEE